MGTRVGIFVGCLVGIFVGCLVGRLVGLLLRVGLIVLRREISAANKMSQLNVSMELQVPVCFVGYHDEYLREESRAEGWALRWIQCGTECRRKRRRFVRLHAKKDVCLSAFSS